MVTIVFGVCNLIVNPPAGPLNYTLAHADAGIGVAVDGVTYDHYTVYDEGISQYIMMTNTTDGTMLWITGDLRGPIPPRNESGYTATEYDYPPWIACNGQSAPLYDIEWNATPD